jgi:glycosyltransferase involved in cell wall biosynthesis
VQDSQADLPASDFFIVAPVLDEADALPSLLAELEDVGLLGQTLFVDNGSTDGGPSIIAAAGGQVLREPRRGYGYPCLTGARVAAARGARAVVFMEADGTDDPAQVRHLVGPILAGAVDLVVGERRAAVRPRAMPGDWSAACSPAGLDATGRMPLHQRLGNDWLALSLRLLFSLCLTDDGPFRAVRLDLLERLRLEERAYAFPTEMLVKAHLCGARIAVRETRYRPRAGRSKIAGTARGTFGAVRDIAWCLVRLRLLGFHADP